MGNTTTTTAPASGFSVGNLFSSLQNLALTGSQVYSNIRGTNDNSAQQKENNKATAEVGSSFAKWLPLAIVGAVVVIIGAVLLLRRK